MPTLGIDVGASKVRYVIWEGNQALLDEEVKLPAPGREELGRVFQEISQKIKETKVSTVGVGLPGTVEEEMVTYAPNFPTLLEWDFKPELEKLLNAPVRLFNDAKAFVFAKFFQKFGKSPDELRQLAEDGDQTAKQAFNEFGKNMGTIIANLVNLLDPEVIVLGGGIAGAYDFFIEETKKAAAGLIVNPNRKNIEIKKAALGNSAGAIGAAILAMI